MPPPQTDPNKPLTLSQKYNLFRHGCRMLAVPWTPLIRWPGSWGERHAGPYAAVGVFFYLLLVTHWNPRHACLLFWVMCAAFLVHRIARMWQSGPVHSLYDGYPILCVVRRWITGKPGDEVKTKEGGDIALMALAAFGVATISPGVGFALGLGAFGQAIECMGSALQCKAIQRSMTDAMIEHGLIVGQHRRVTSPAGGSAPGRRLAWAVLLAVLGLGGWLAYTGQLQMPEIPEHVAAYLPAWAQPSEEERERLRVEEEERRWDAEIRAEEARERRQRAAWRRWNAGYGY